MSIQNRSVQPNATTVHLPLLPVLKKRSVSKEEETVARNMCIMYD